MNDSIEYLKKCDTAYYNTGTLEISDKEYDILKTQCKEWYPEDPYFQTIGAPVAGEAVKLPYILGSLVKTKPDGSLYKWCIDNNIKKITISDKLDGVSIYAKYVKGSLVRASTRGDGYEGKDITEKVRLIKPTVKDLGTIEIRGEALMTPENCEKLGYSLPRSAVSGILNGDDQEHYDKCDHVDILFYNVLGKELTCYSDHFTMLGVLGCDIPQYQTIEVTEDIEDILAKWFETRKKESKYDVDGVVVADMTDATVGEDYYPTNMVAFKVNQEAVRCTVDDVVWGVRRSGKIQPVVYIDPVNIDGSNVSKATGFNAKFIEDNGIGKGSEIGLVKSGDIIPYITETFVKTTPSIPDKCPSCGGKLEWTPTHVDLICGNYNCMGKMVYKIENFLLSHEVEEITYTTILRLGVSTIEDLYSLTDFDISMIEGMGMKRAQTILNQLQKTLNTTPEKLLKSFGIKGIGNTVSDVIISNFGSFDVLFEKSVDDFMTLDGIGEVLANSIVEGLSEHVKLYIFLKEQGLKFKEKKSMDLQGKIFTLTGKSDINRNDLVKMISSHGGMVKGISKKVSYLVTNDVDSTSSKMVKATKYGIPIISYDELLSIIG